MSFYILRAVYAVLYDYFSWTKLAYLFKSNEDIYEWGLA